MGRELRQPLTDGVNMPLVNIVNGGTGQVTAPLALDALDAIPASSINQPNGIAGSDSDGNLLPTVLSGVASSEIAIVGNSTLSINEVAVYTITNYSSFINYTLDAISGTATRVGDTITFTAPSVGGPSGFTINGRTITIAVGTPTPITPSILSPLNNTTNVGSSLNISVSNFDMVGGADTHYSTDWQIATDSGFTTIVAQSIDDTVNKLSWTVTELSANTTYFIRVRFRATLYGYGNYSSIYNFTTKVNFLPDTETAILIASDKATSDYFGTSLDIDSTGARVVIGAPYDDIPGGVNGGSVYIFTKSESGWTQEAKLVASDPQSYVYFGHSVGISGDGTRCVVGSIAADTPSVGDAGKAYVFSRSGTVWTQEAMFYASDREPSDQFGYSVSMDQTGTRCIIGANLAAPGELGNAGAAYIFTRSGTVWSQEAILSASDKYNNDEFGYSVDIDSIGTRVVIGAISADIGGIENTGAAYIFTRSGTVWTQEAKLSASDKMNSAKFGFTVSITGNGDRVVIGAPYDTANSLSLAGSAYIFTRSGTTWTEEAILTASDKLTGDLFSNSVSISGAGDSVVIGSRLSDPSGITSAGKTYIFTRSGTTWTEEAILTASDKSAGDYFGHSVSISLDGSGIVIGSILSNTGGITDTGKAYIFS